MSATLTPSPAAATEPGPGSADHGPRAADLGTYRDLEGRTRAVIVRPGAGGSVLVIDQDAETLTDRRLVAHLAADEPAINAQMVAELYLADHAGRWARALQDRDWVTLPGGRELPQDPEPASTGELEDAGGRRYRLAAVEDHRHGRQVRWMRRGGRRRAEPVALRTVIGALEAIEPARALTRAALKRPPADAGTELLARELRKLEDSPRVLNRGLREAVHRRVRSGELSLSCIASRCGRGKRRATGLRIGDTTWLQRRLGRSSWPNAPDRTPRADPVDATGGGRPPTTAAAIPARGHRGGARSPQPGRRPPLLTTREEQPDATTDCPRGPRRTRAPPAPGRGRATPRPGATRAGRGARRTRALGRLGPPGRPRRASTPGSSRPGGGGAVTSTAIADSVDLVDPTGARRSSSLSPAGHVALFARALHAPAAAALRERAGMPGLVEACAVTRGHDGRPRPHRSGGRQQFSPCGHIVPLQALATAARTVGQECWCSVLPRTEPTPGGKAVPGGRLLWADVDTPGTLWRARALRERVPVRLVVESGGATDPGEVRWHLYLVVSRWLDVAELEAANARLAKLLGGDRVGDRGRLMRLPGTRNFKGGRPGHWCRVVACDLHAPALEVEAVVGALPGPVKATPTPDGRLPHAGRSSLDELRPRDWFALLEPGRPISEYGYAQCPLHDDHIPSLKLYDEPRDGWYCWACARGGDFVEYAAWRWYGRAGRELSRPEFRELVSRLQAHVTIPVTPCSA